MSKKIEILPNQLIIRFRICDVCDTRVRFKFRDITIISFFILFKPNNLKPVQKLFLRYFLAKLALQSFLK